MERAKAVMTVGPASWDLPVLEPVTKKGFMGVARENCSHAVEIDHYKQLEIVARRVRKIATECNRHVGIFYDAPGQKIRNAGLKEKIPLVKGQILVFTDEEQPGIGCTHRGYLDLGAVGKKVYTGDGGAEDPQLVIVAKGAGWLECQVTSGKELQPRKGITIEGAQVSLLGLPAVTDHDVMALRAGIAVEADYLGMSYGTKASQFRLFIEKARELGASKKTKYVFKYELGDAEEDLDNIVDLADVMYVGQGDLNLSVSYLELVRHRRRVINACKAAGKECWVGTGLLMSLVRGKIPKPGEIAGILQVWSEGPTALVLSDEFSVADDPFLSAQVLNETIEFAEAGY